MDRIGADSQVGIGFETIPGQRAPSLIATRFDVEIPIELRFDHNLIERAVVGVGFSPRKKIIGMRRIPPGTINKELYTRGDGYFWRMLFGQIPATTAPIQEQLLPPTPIAPVMSLATQPTEPNRPAILMCTVAGATAWGTITIAGKDGNDDDITETLTYTGNATKNTTKYFKSVNANGITTSGFTGGTLAINGNRNTYRHVFTLSNNIPSVTIEISKGGFPFTYWGCGLNSANLKIDAPEGLVKMSLSFLGKDGWAKSLAGTTIPSSLSSLVNEVFKNWKCGLRIDNTLIGIKSLNFTASNNLLEDVSEIKEGDSHMTPRLVRGGKREITGTFNLQFEDSSFYDKWVRGSEVALKVNATSIPYGGPKEIVEFEFPTVNFGGTDPSVSDMGLIYQDIPFSAYGESNNEFRLTLFSTDANYN